MVLYLIVEKEVAKKPPQLIAKRLLPPQLSWQSTRLLTAQSRVRAPQEVFPRFPFWVNKNGLRRKPQCAHSSVVEWESSTLLTRVRFPLGAVRHTEIELDYSPNDDISVCSFGAFVQKHLVIVTTPCFLASFTVIQKEAFSQGSQLRGRALPLQGRGHGSDSHRVQLLNQKNKI